MKSDALFLVVESHSCSCGQKWTHSYSLLASQAHGYMGGSPNYEHERLPYVGYEHWSQVNHSGCFRCIPLALGEGWTRPKVVEKPSKTEILAADLLK
jgi:hypothetical protein